MSKTQTILNKIAMTALVGALAFSFTSPVRADPILGQFSITAGTLNAKLIGLTTFNSAYATGATTPYGYADAALTSFGNTVPSAINLKSDSVSPLNPSNTGSQGTTDPVASTSNQIVHGVFTAAWLNGAGSSYNSTLTVTNFAKADVSGTILAPEVVLPVYSASVSKLSMQASSVVANNSSNYTGASTANIGTELTSVSPVTSVSGTTSSGVSNTFTLLDFNTGAGLGEYYKRTGVNFTIPAFTQTGKYVSTLTFTNTVE